MLTLVDLASFPISRQQGGDADKAFFASVHVHVLRSRIPDLPVVSGFSPTLHSFVPGRLGWDRDDVEYF